MSTKITKDTKSTKDTKGIKSTKRQRASSTSGDIKDISSMRPMERYRYVAENYKVCPTCNSKKRLTVFWNKHNNTINDNCNRCNKKLYEIEVMKIVLGVLKKSEVL